MPYGFLRSVIRNGARASSFALVGAAAALTGCGLVATDVDLVQDQRVAFDAPEKGADVRLPVTVSWHAHDVDGRTFAVFVDRSPVRPGDSLRKLAEDEHDDACLARPGCPGAGWLRNRGVYLTDADALTLRTLPDTRDTGRGARDAHEVTVVLMRDGRRDGEGAWTRRFYVDRSAS